MMLENTEIITQQQQQQHPFNGPLSRTTWVSRYQKGKTKLYLLEHNIVSGSGISWAKYKSAPRPRQITAPAPNHSVFSSLLSISIASVLSLIHI